LGKVRPIDPEHSSFTIHVVKSGLLSVAGHDHEVVAPIAEGIVDDAEPGHVCLRIEAAKLTVLPEQDQAEVQSTMQSRVLESKSFPEIRFESISIAKVGDGKWGVQKSCKSGRFRVLASFCFPQLTNGALRNR
jgi:hypothetical protein